MKTARFEVLSAGEIDRIHAASMDVLDTTGVQVDWKPAQDLFREAGARIDDETNSVRIPEKLVRWAVEQAPSQFRLHGSRLRSTEQDAAFYMDIGGDNVCFAGLGTPTHIIDGESGQRRETIMTDVIRHIQLINGCQHIHNSQMDIWPNDVPMTTIHAEAIWAWAHHSHKSFGMGCYGYLPTLDMMRMMAIVAGGKEAARRRPSFLAICSVNSPLQMIQMQLEGLLICADYGQPLAMSPEAIAGATAPVTLAGLLVQQNANILAHVALAQIFRPGTPVLYGTVSTIANMRTGTVALGAVETGLITAGAAQLARFYGLPCRSVGGVTESKQEDLQAGLERTSTLLPAVLAGVNLITCGGTLDGTMLESDAMLLLDDELCGVAMRMARGVEVNEGTLALDLIQQIGFSGNYLAEPHTVRRFRQEHYIPSLLPREPYSAWVEGGSRSALDHAKDRVREILDQHHPRELDPDMEQELDSYRQMVTQRPLEDFYLHEMEDKQDWDAL